MPETSEIQPNRTPAAPAARPFGKFAVSAVALLALQGCLRSDPSYPSRTASMGEYFPRQAEPTLRETPVPPTSPEVETDIRNVTARFVPESGDLELLRDFAKRRAAAFSAGRTEGYASCRNFLTGLAGREGPERSEKILDVLADLDRAYASYVRGDSTRQITQLRADVAPNAAEALPETLLFDVLCVVNTEHNRILSPGDDRRKNSRVVLLELRRGVPAVLKIPATIGSGVHEMFFQVDYRQDGAVFIVPLQEDGKKPMPDVESVRYPDWRPKAFTVQNLLRPRGSNFHRTAPVRPPVLEFGVQFDEQKRTFAQKGENVKLTFLPK